MTMMKVAPDGAKLALFLDTLLASRLLFRAGITVRCGLDWPLLMIGLFLILNQ